MKAGILSKKMTKKIELQDGYQIESKNQNVTLLRKLFGRAKKLEKLKQKICMNKKK